MKPSLFSKFQCALILFTFTACSTALTNINVLQPAEISIPSSIQKVSLFPGAGIPNLPGKFDSINHVLLKHDYNYNQVKRGYMQGVFETLQQSPRFSRVVMTDSSYANLLDDGVISWDELRGICIQDSTDAVLLLKKAVTRDRLVYFNENDEENYCGLRYSLISYTKWCFYQPFLLFASDDFAFTDFNSYEQEVSCSLPGPVDNLIDILYDACILTGNRFGDQICPSWTGDIQRIIYKGPGKSLKQAYFLASHSQWHQAAVIWNDLSNSPNKKQASRASFNLALAWERDDDLDQAEEWAQYADSLCTSQRTKAYMIILEQRIRLKAELDSQMKGE
jgi:hypothetical protein